MFNLCFSGAKVEGMNFITVAGIFHFYYQTGCRYGVIEMYLFCRFLVKVIAMENHYLCSVFNNILY